MLSMCSIIEPYLQPGLLTTSCRPSLLTTSVNWWLTNGLLSQKSTMLVACPVIKNEWVKNQKYVLFFLCQRTQHTSPLT
jgi:hypothetical protein